MRSYHVNSGAGIEGLVVREHKDPEPGPGEVVIAVRATSLSFREVMILRGDYVLPVKPDVVPISDGAGEVVAVGPGVGAEWIGRRVMATLFPSWQYGPFGVEHLAQRGGSLDGMLTELAVVEERSLVPVPDYLSFEEAATLPCVAVTAWNALSGLRPGDTVVTQGSGGVSLFAVQFAAAMGARVISTTGSPGKVARLKELGADEVVDYRATPDWHLRVVELTGQGADRVIDVTGQLEKSLQAVRLGGQVACVGFLGDTAEPIDPWTVFGSGATLRAVAVGSRAQFQDMLRLMEVRRLRPVIDRVFAFDDAVDAYRHYISAAPFGKVVIGRP